MTKVGLDVDEKSRFVVLAGNADRSTPPSMMLGVGRDDGVVEGLRTRVAQLE